MDTTRRAFLSAAVAAPFVYAADKSGNKLPVIGDGDHRYEVIHDWGELPDRIKWGNTHGVCEDSNGHIYVHHTVHKDSQSDDSVVVFDAKGKFVRSWGPQYKTGAHGLRLRKEGREEYLYLADQLHAVVTKRTLRGEEVWTIGYPTESDKYRQNPGPGGGIVYRPGNVAIASNGDVYVADVYGSFYINQYDKNAKYIRTFGGNGKEIGQFNTPHGLMIDHRTGSETLLVADRGNHRIQRLSLDGKPMEVIEGTLWPCFFHEHNGDVVVPDLQARVTLLDKNNKVIEHLGDGGLTQQQFFQARTKARDTFVPGKFICPHGAIFDHTGNIFVVEWVEVGRVTKLRKVA